MTTTAWRFVKAKHQDHPFAGEGARLFGGRWNNPGTPIVYAASAISLALLELLAYLEDASVLSSYVLFRAEIRENLIETLATAILPRDWRASPAHPSTKAIGDKWFHESRSAVLSVPSAVSPLERNYLVNPAHRDFRKIKTSGPLEYVFDPRIVELTRH
jgi:RES domain-containing protein